MRLQALQKLMSAWPLAQFVKSVKEYDAEVQVTNLTRGKGPVSGG